MLMESELWFGVVGLSLVGVLSAGAGVVRGVLSVTGAEMG
jgi:hypothetical protein